MDIPKLYKYRYFIEDKVPRICSSDGEQIAQWQSVLYDGILLPASPSTFNDLYDCDFLLDDNFLNSKTGRELIEKQLSIRCPLSIIEKQLIYNSNDLDSVVRSILRKYYGVRTKNIFQMMIRELHNLLNNCRNNLRVICFSDANNSPLMWSHYAKDNSGFAIEYDLNAWECKEHISPVKYIDKREKIPWDFLDDVGQSQLSETIKNYTLYKSKEWDYEREWRLVISRYLTTPNVPKLACFLADYITGVYLGERIEEHFEREILHHYKNTPVRIYRMQHAKNDFSLIPVLIQG